MRLRRTTERRCAIWTFNEQFRLFAANFNLMQNFCRNKSVFWWPKNQICCQWNQVMHDTFLSFEAELFSRKLAKNVLSSWNLCGWRSHQLQQPGQREDKRANRQGNSQSLDWHLFVKTFGKTEKKPTKVNSKTCARMDIADDSILRTARLFSTQEPSMPLYMFIHRLHMKF